MIIKAGKDSPSAFYSIPINCRVFGARSGVDFKRSEL